MSNCQHPKLVPLHEGIALACPDCGIEWWARKRRSISASAAGSNETDYQARLNGLRIDPQNEVRGE